MAKDNLEA